MISDLPIGTRRCLRIAFGVIAASALAYGADLPLPYLTVLMVATLLAPPVPPPDLKQSIGLLLLMVLTSFWGILLGPVIIHVPSAGFLLILAGVGLASALAVQPATLVLGSLIIVGSSIIAVFASKSSAGAVILMQMIVAATVIALVISRLSHGLFPEGPANQQDPAEQDSPLPTPAVSNAGWIGVRAALIMAVPILLALQNPGAYVMLLMKGALLARQVETASARSAGWELIGSTLAGGVAALIFWAVISLWPNLLILAFGFGVISFFIARWMYAVVPNRLTFDFWNNSLLTMIILIGPTVSDSQSGTDIDQAIVIRMAMFIALSFYAFALVHVLDYWRDNYRTPVAANDADGPNTAV
jgi:hypothetical protein